MNGRDFNDHSHKVTKLYRGPHGIREFIGLLGSGEQWMMRYTKDL